uniref:Mediator of RNA polymerase II transcription subunit 8 n=1 Tax=Plectus sambesii TaxID=2011161 RepID=A0A914UQ14_9BILA
MQSERGDGVVSQAILHLEQKATDIKQTIQQLLYMLDFQDKVRWPEMLDKFATLANDMTQLQNTLRRSGLPTVGKDDYGILLKSHLVVPSRLSLDIDPALQQTTEGRVASWNHDVLPEYLRTKPDTEIENDEKAILNEKTQKQFETCQKQIQTLNKHIDSLIGQLTESSRQSSEKNQETKTYNDMDTRQLVKAIMNGEQLRPNQSQPMQPSGGGKAIPPSRQTTKAAAASNPYQR